MSKQKIRVDNGYFFILSLFLFILNALFITVLLAQDFKNTSDLFTYFFSAGGFFYIIQSFVVGYGNLTYSIRHKKWYTLVSELILVMFQLTCFFLAIIWFKQDTYPQVTVGYLALGTLGTVAQLVIGRFGNVIKYQIVAFGFYSILFGLFFWRIFPFISDIRFIQFISVISMSIELILLLNVYRAFQRKDIISIKKLS